jgi:phosphoglycolate phosphatase-like HAD superfamily hydrolase
MDAPQNHNTTPHPQAKFKDYLKQEHTPKYRIYVDMDGVLCDFAKAVHDIDGKTTVDDIDKMPESSFWKFIVDGTKGGLKAFFGKMEWLPEGKKFWNFIKDKKPTILSAVKEPGKQEAIDGKNEWLDREIGKEQARKFVERKDKQAFADDKAILIDDYDKNIKEWTEKGGIGILFRTTDEVVKKLNELGINEFYDRYNPNEVIEKENK